MMTTKRNILTLSLSALLIVSLSVFAFADGHGRYRDGGCPGRSGEFSQLTPEKRAAVDSIFKKYDAQFAELRTEMMTKHSVLEAMINKGETDEQKIGALVGGIQSLRGQIQDLRGKMSVEIEKETGISMDVRNCAGFQGGRGHGRGHGYGHGGKMGYGSGDCPRNNS